MNTAVVHGTDVTMYVFRDDWRKAMCATSCSLEGDTEELDITTIDSGKATDTIGTFTRVRGTIEGIITLDETLGFQFDEFLDSLGTREGILLQYKNIYGDMLSYQFTALFTRVSNSNSE